MLCFVDGLIYRINRKIKFNFISLILKISTSGLREQIMIENMKKILKERDFIISQLTKKLEETQAAKDFAFREAEVYHHKYIKTTVNHLQTMGFVITNSIGNKGNRYLFFDVTDLHIHQTFVYHKDAKIVEVDKVVDKVLPTSFTSELENSVNYCDMLIEDLYKLQHKVQYLSLQVQQLHKQKEKALANSSSQQKINVNLPFLRQDTTIIRKTSELVKRNNSISIPLQSIEQKKNLQEQDNPERPRSSGNPQLQNSEVHMEFSPPNVQESQRHQILRKREKSEQKRNESDVKMSKAGQRQNQSGEKEEKLMRSIIKNEDGLKNSQNRLDVDEQEMQIKPPFDTPSKKSHKIIYIRK